MVVMILEKEEGAVMQEGGVPSLSLQSRLIDLPTTLPFKMTFKKKMSLSRCREVETSKVPNFQSEKKRNVHPAKQQGAQHFIR